MCSDSYVQYYFIVGVVLHLCLCPLCFGRIGLLVERTLLCSRQDQGGGALREAADRGPRQTSRSLMFFKWCGPVWWCSSVTHTGTPCIITCDI